MFKFVPSGHKDSVTCTGFSHDGVYVATADLSGLIKVWKVETKAEVWSFECSDIEVSSDQALELHSHFLHCINLD